MNADRFPIISRLADLDFFYANLTVMNQAVTWDTTGRRDPRACIDLDPVRMYENTPVVADPLGDVA